MKERIQNLIQMMESAVAETLHLSIHNHLTNGLVTLDMELEMMDYDEMALEDYLETTQIIVDVIDLDFEREKEILLQVIDALQEITSDMQRVNDLMEQIEDNLIQ
jgi:hypothetical protein